MNEKISYKKKYILDMDKDCISDCYQCSREHKRIFDKCFITKIC